MDTVYHIKIDVSKTINSIKCTTKIKNGLTCISNKMNFICI